VARHRIKLAAASVAVLAALTTGSPGALAAPHAVGFGAASFQSVTIDCSVSGIGHGPVVLQLGNITLKSSSAEVSYGAGCPPELDGINLRLTDVSAHPARSAACRWPAPVVRVITPKAVDLRGPGTCQGLATGHVFVGSIVLAVAGNRQTGATVGIFVIS
jgi:hypothetical protein